MSKKIGVYYLHHERGYDGLIAEFFVKHDDRIYDYEAYGRAYGLPDYFEQCPYVKAFIKMHPDYRYVGDAGQYLSGDNAGKFDMDLSNWKLVDTPNIDKKMEREYKKTQRIVE